MDARQGRGRRLAQDPRIKPVDGALWFVPSETHGGYLVNVESATCGCQDFLTHKLKCKHLWAVEIVRAALPAPSVPQDGGALVAAPRALALGRGEFTAEEVRHVRAALRFVRIRSGGWEPLAKALRVKAKSLTNGNAVSPRLVLRLARAAGVPVEDLLSGRYPPAGACPHCGHCPPPPDPPA